MKRPVKLLQVLRLVRVWFDRFVVVSVRVRGVPVWPQSGATGITTVATGQALPAPSLTRRLIEEHVRRPRPPTARQAH